MNLKQNDYGRHSSYYDEIELAPYGNSVAMNKFLHGTFKKRKVKTVLDLSCGTGAQAIGLAKYGYKVTGSDLSAGMLAKARKKARGLGIKFRQADMTKPQSGKFDAAISMFNAVAHLTPVQLGQMIFSFTL